MSFTPTPVGVKPFPEPAMSKKQPIIAPPHSFFTRIMCGVRLWAFKIFVVVMLRLIRTFKPSQFIKVAPTYTKRYSVLPQLECRVFIPSTYKSGTNLPLLINIHGGGFAIGDPQMDDHFCRPFSDKYGFCVVSINYRKAPSYPYPVPVNDAAELARMVLADTNLPVDSSKVAIGGFSAGGNLTLAVAQLPGIKEKVRALVPIYPVVDFSARYKGQFRISKTGKRDMLEKTSAMFNWGYISAGQDRADPLLSPIYATREDLPQKIFFVCAQDDYLCHEAECMAKKLAGLEGEVDLGKRWDKNGIKLLEVPDVQHGFTHVQLKGQEEVDRKRICNEVYEEIADWLKRALA